MKTKHKILTINLLVVFTTILTFITGAFSVLMKTFSMKDFDVATISVAADNKTTFKKEGLLDLLGGDLDFSVGEPINISTKEEAISLYDSYMQNNFYSGKVKAVSSTFVVGGGSLAGVSEVYYGIVKSESYFSNGEFHDFSYYCKIPNADGDDNGAHAEANYIEKTTIIDGVETCQIVKGEKDVCYYTYENGVYQTHVVESAFENKTKKEKVLKRVSGLELFQFFINNETVSSVQIDSTSNFVIKVKYKILGSAIQKYREHIRDSESNSVGLPTFNALNFEVTFNRFSGDIIEISKYESYTLPCIFSVDVDVSRSQSLVFKKEN